MGCKTFFKIGVSKNPKPSEKVVQVVTGMDLTERKVMVLIGMVIMTLVEECMIQD